MKNPLHDIGKHSHLFSKEAAKLAKKKVHGIKVNEQEEVKLGKKLQEKELKSQLVDSAGRPVPIAELSKDIKSAERKSFFEIHGYYPEEAEAFKNKKFAVAKDEEAKDEIKKMHTNVKRKRPPIKHSKKD